MKYAVFSDIHGNLPALQAVLRDAEGNGCEGYLCAGDIVGMMSIAPLGWSWMASMRKRESK